MKWNEKDQRGAFGLRAAAYCRLQRHYPSRRQKKQMQIN